jgi:hypothetical protein
MNSYIEKKQHHIAKQHEKEEEKFSKKEKKKSERLSKTVNRENSLKTKGDEKDDSIPSSRSKILGFSASKRLADGPSPRNSAPNPMMASPRITVAFADPVPSKEPATNTANNNSNNNKDSNPPTSATASTNPAQASASASATSTIPKQSANASEKPVVVVTDPRFSSTSSEEDEKATQAIPTAGMESCFLLFRFDLSCFFFWLFFFWFRFAFILILKICLSPGLAASSRSTKL